MQPLFLCCIAFLLSVVLSQQACPTSPIKLVDPGGACDASNICDPAKSGYYEKFDPTPSYQKLSMVSLGFNGCVQPNPLIPNGICALAGTVPDGGPCSDPEQCKSGICKQRQCGTSTPPTEPAAIGDPCTRQFCVGDLVCDLATKKCVANDGKNSAPAKVGEACDKWIKPCEDPAATFCYMDPSTSTYKCQARAKTGGTCETEDWCPLGNICGAAKKCEAIAAGGACTAPQPATPMPLCNDQNKPLLCSRGKWTAPGTVQATQQAQLFTLCEPGLWWDKGSCASTLSCSDCKTCKNKSVYGTNVFCDVQKGTCAVLTGLKWTCDAAAWQQNLEEQCTAKNQEYLLTWWPPVATDYLSQRQQIKTVNTHQIDQTIWWNKCWAAAVNDVTSLFDVYNPMPNVTAPSMNMTAPSMNMTAPSMNMTAPSMNTTTPTDMPAMMAPTPATIMPPSAPPSPQGGPAPSLTPAPADMPAPAGQPAPADPTIPSSTTTPAATPAATPAETPAEPPTGGSPTSPGAPSYSPSSPAAEPPSSRVPPTAVTLIDTINSIAPTAADNTSCVKAFIDCYDTAVKAYGLDKPTCDQMQAAVGCFQACPATRRTCETFDPRCVLECEKKKGSPLAAIIGGVVGGLALLGALLLGAVLMRKNKAKKLNNNLNEEYEDANYDDYQQDEYEGDEYDEDGNFEDYDEY